MQAHYLQHVPFEGLGSIETWLRKAGYEISCTQFFGKGSLPEIEAIDFLVVMGGPMSVNDESDHPWLAVEKEFIRNVIEAGKPVLGICLGAQLIANSMGAKVLPNSVKEIGWYPIVSVKTKGMPVFQFPEKTEVFHWHGETFCLPEGATRIAESEGCKNQAFQIGSNVIGLQFHLETTPDSAKAIVEHCNDELAEGEFIQSEADILSECSGRYSSINNLMAEVLEYLHARRG